MKRAGRNVRWIIPVAFLVSLFICVLIAGAAGDWLVAVLVTPLP